MSDDVVETDADDSDSSVEDESVQPIAGIGTLVFSKWDATEVTCSDPGIAPYINLTTKFL